MNKTTINNIKQNYGKIKSYKIKELELEKYLELFSKKNIQLESNLIDLNSTYSYLDEIGLGEYSYIDTIIKNSLVWQELNKYSQNEFKIMEVEYISPEKARDILKSYIYYSQDVWNKYVDAETYEYYSSEISSYEFLSILVNILVDVNRHYLIDQALPEMENNKTIQRLLTK